MGFIVPKTDPKNKKPGTVFQCFPPISLKTLRIGTSYNSPRRIASPTLVFCYILLTFAITAGASSCHCGVPGVPLCQEVLQMFL